MSTSSQKQKRTVETSTILLYGAARQTWASLLTQVCRSWLTTGRLRPVTYSNVHRTFSLTVTLNEFKPALYKEIKTRPLQGLVFIWSCWADLNCRTSSLPRKRSTDWATTAHINQSLINRQILSYYMSAKKSITKISIYFLFYALYCIINSLTASMKLWSNFLIFFSLQHCS